MTAPPDRQTCSTSSVPSLSSSLAAKAEFFVYISSARRRSPGASSSLRVSGAADGGCRRGYHCSDTNGIIGRHLVRVGAGGNRQPEFQRGRRSAHHLGLIGADLLPQPLAGRNRARPARPRPGAERLHALQAVFDRIAEMQYGPAQVAAPENPSRCPRPHRANHGRYDPGSSAAGWCSFSRRPSAAVPPAWPCRRG